VEQFGRENKMEHPIVSQFVVLLAIIVIFARFIDKALLRDVHRQQLQKKFEDWWLVVADYDTLQLALILATKTNEFLDFAFGPKLISKKVLKRGFVISSFLLLITLLSLGIIKNQPFGVTPWRNYKESIDATVSMAASIGSVTNVTTFKVMNIAALAPEVNKSTNQMFANVHSNLLLLTMTTNGIIHIDRMYPLGGGEISVQYGRLFRADSWTNFMSNSTNAYTMMHDDMEYLSRYANSFNRPSFMTIYSLAYFVTLFAANAFIFAVSLAACRVLLREISSSSGKIVPTLCLVFTNVVVVLCLCCVLLLIFTILAVPFFWLFLPLLDVIGAESVETLAACLITAAIGVWIVVGGPAKIVVFIAFLPNILAGIVGGITLLTVKWRKQFHFIVSEILIRFVEKQPLAFFITVVTFVAILLVGIVDHFHFTDFL
jgi:hypothetical protein